MIGYIDVEGGISVADPCYFDGSPWMIKHLDALPGQWAVEVEMDDHEENRVSKLIAYATESHLVGSQPGARHLEGFAGVDSGQMMLISGDALNRWKDEDFALESEPGGKITQYVNVGHIGRLSYNGACLATLTGPAGILEGKAAVSSSGWGDGSYPVWTSRDDNGKVVFITVDFDPDDEEWPEEEEDEDE